MLINSIFFADMKKCLFVGSFNPITKAHFNIIVDLLKEKTIDYLYFLPVNSKKSDLVDISKRLKMLELIKTSNMEVLDIRDYNINGLFNTNILKKIKESKDITHIVMGSDLFLNLKNFLDYEYILKTFTLIIVKRLDFDIETYIEKEFKEYKDKFIIINKEYNGSSSLAKLALKEKENKYLNKEVLEYIKENNLYKDYY